MIGPLSRIIARYLAGALVAYGFFAPGDAAVIEPDLALALGAAAGAAVEGLYAWARGHGWST